MLLNKFYWLLFDRRTINTPYTHNRLVSEEVRYYMRIWFIPHRAFGMYCGYDFLTEKKNVKNRKSIVKKTFQNKTKHTYVLVNSLV